MNLLTLDDLKTLIEKHEGLCISMFMGTHRGGPEIRQNPIRLKNLLREAEEQLLANGLRAPEVKKRLEPLHAFVEDSFFWRDQSDGLAIFRSAEELRYYRLPVHFDELVVVTNRFHIKPILPLFHDNGRFFVLALSLGNIRLLECSRYRVREVELENVPRSIEEALRYDEPERQIQFQTGTQARTGGKRAAIFHGHGGSSDSIKDNIIHYFHQVDRGLHDLLREERVPLVLWGIDYLLPIYREANRYPSLLDKGVTRDPEGLRPDELQKEAWTVVQPYFLREQKDAMEKYRELVGTGRTSNEIEGVLRAAHEGRVETLFVAVCLQQWGAFHPDTYQTHLHDREEPGDEDLLDLATVQTFLHRGAVYAVQPEDVPDGERVAAVFRY